MSGKVIATAGKVGYELAGGVARSVASRLGDVVSIRDFGADGAGVVDCSTILTAMLAAGHRIVSFPAGIYRFPTKVDVPAGTALIGAGWQVCTIEAGGDWWIECFRSHAPDVTTDWCRCTVTGFLIRMAKGGIRFWGHEFRASDLRFAGGGAHMDMADATTWIADPAAWCIEGIAANELYLGRISGGYGGNNAVNTLFANGIRLTALDVDATEDLANYLEPPTSGQNQRGVNYGDGLLEEISLKGRGTGPGWRSATRAPPRACRTCSRCSACSSRRATCRRACRAIRRWRSRSAPGSTPGRARWACGSSASAAAFSKRSTPRPAKSPGI